MQRALLYRLVDAGHELTVLPGGRLGVARLGRALEPAEVGLHRALEPAILVVLAIGAVDSLYL